MSAFQRVLIFFCNCGMPRLRDNLKINWKGPMWQTGESLYLPMSDAEFMGGDQNSSNNAEVASTEVFRWHCS